jgi:hypothetical protein
LFAILLTAVKVEGRVYEQEVSIEINGRQIDTIRVAGSFWHLITVKRELLLGCEELLSLKPSNPIRPSSLSASSDDRLLAVDLGGVIIFENLDSLDESKKISVGDDRLGPVFSINSRFFRGVRQDAAPFFNKLISAGAIDSLVRRNLLLFHSIKRSNSARYSHILSSPSGHFIYPGNYPLNMLLDAALKWISMNEVLDEFSGRTEQPFGLMDGHYGNFVQIKNADPRWCDIGSIQDSTTLFMHGLKEFIGCFVYPLLTMSIGGIARIKHVRRLMHMHPRGLDDEILRRENLALSPPTSNLTHLDQADRMKALGNIRQMLQELKFDGLESDWDGYRSASALQEALSGRLIADSPDTRFSAIASLMDGSDVRTFVDIGCNDGLFSLIGVGKGMTGMAVDLDESALNKLYDFVKNHTDLDLSIAVSSFLEINGEFDMVMMLALTHHLSLSQGLSFSKIAEKLEKITKKIAIIEFMPDGLGGTKAHPAPSPNPLPSWYCIDNFMFELRKVFSRSEIIEYNRDESTPWFSRRTLILCNK